MYLTVTHPLGYMLVRSATKGVEISCGSIQWVIHLKFILPLWNTMVNHAQGEYRM